MTKKEILSICNNIVKRKEDYPDLTDLAREGVTRDQIRKEFGNLSGLYDRIAESSNLLFDINRTTIARPQIKKKRLVITTAVTGSKVDTKFLNNVDAYCKAFSAELVVVVSVLNKNMLLDPKLLGRNIMVQDQKINSNLSIIGIRNAAKAVDPVSGLPRVGRRNGSIIGPSPKQRLKFVATGISALPHALMTTGAITKPNYAASTVLVNKTDYIADYDHVMGALIVEIENDKMFHFRQIQADKNGSFVDLGTLVENGKMKSMAPEAFILGDWHSGSTDPKVAKSLIEITKAIKPKSWILHDIYDGMSVNPHTVNKNATKAILANEGKLNLKVELDMLKADILMMSKLVSKVVIVRSNHDDFLDRYLNAGDYVQDPVNHRIALDLAAHLIDGKNPLEEHVGKIKNVEWLKLDESYEIAGYECGMHGHLGANGARGSITSMEQAYGKVIFGHSHTAQIQRDSINVGTSTYLELGYNKGASSWTQTSCLLYPNGQRQLINFINGDYSTRKL